MSSETLKRINLDRVREMFDAAGITAARKENNQCIMAAVLHPVKFYTYIQTEGYEWNRHYVAGLIDGWDDTEVSFRRAYDFIIKTTSLEYKLGVADGQAAAKKMGLP